MPENDEKFKKDPKHFNKLQIFFKKNADIKILINITLQVEAIR